MPKITSKKPEKEEALELIESLTEKLKEAVSAEPKLRQKADALSSTMLKNHDKDSDTAKKMKFAIRVLMVADTLINEEIEIEEVDDMKAVLVMTAETVFGLSRLEAIALASDIGETVFDVFQEDEQEETTAVYKTLCVLTACLDVLRELPKED